MKHAIAQRSLVLSVANTPPAKLAGQLAVRSTRALHSAKQDCQVTKGVDHVVRLAAPQFVQGDEGRLPASEQLDHDLDPFLPGRVGVLSGVDGIRLQPANPDYPAQFYDDVRIQGKLIGVIRRLD